MTEQKKWLPSAWVDEVVPKSGTSPNDFLRRSANGALFIAPIERAADDAHDWLMPEPIAVALGDVVEFSWYVDRGGAVLHLAEDGSYYLDPPFEGEVNCVTDNDGDTIGGSVEEFVKQSTDPDCCGAFPMEPGEHDLRGWYWDEADSFVVSLGANGAAVLERRRPVHHANM